MGYIQKCFIRKNTVELRKKVSMLGTERGISMFDDNKGLLCASEYGIRFHYNDAEIANELIKHGYIDCGTNEEIVSCNCSITG